MTKVGRVICSRRRRAGVKQVEQVAAGGRGGEGGEEAGGRWWTSLIV